MNKEYKGLFVKKSTHKDISVQAKKFGLTIDQFISVLLPYSKRKDFVLLEMSKDKER